MIYNQRTGEFVTSKGPVFANLILADEINRTPPKVQSALLEAMQERQVTIGEQTYKLDDPFLVLATQNPIEQEGTYPLPEAQLDRFLLKIRISYPSREEEREIVERIAVTGAPPTVAVVEPADIIRGARAVQVDLHRPQAQGLHPRPRLRHARAGEGGARRAETAHPLRRLAARLDQPHRGRARDGVPAPARVRDPRGREGAGGRRAAAPHHPQLRGRGRGDDDG
jgi:hypothetical protein